MSNSILHLSVCRGARVQPSRGVQTKVGVEVAQIAGEAGFIAGTALTMVGMTLVVSFRHATPGTACKPSQTFYNSKLVVQVPACIMATHREEPCSECLCLQGLALGFVLLRVEALAEADS